MRKRVLSLVGLSWIILLSGCFIDPNEKANELYVTASQYSQKMQSEAASYSRTLEVYRSAQNGSD
ncbi:hypothetical protein BGP75_01490 [Motiliproteus sp. MSK22-1]|nr:hypothetical protein BGP75_01490 [Motiliproteus sp. MSK22-1]